MNKKIILSVLLVLLVAISVSAVSAEVIDEAAADEVIAEDVVANEVVSEETIAEPNDDVLAADGDPEPEPSADAAEIRNKINVSAGTTVTLDPKVYNIMGEQINITVDNLIIKGQEGTVINIDGKAQGNGTGFNVISSGVTIEGIYFNNTNGEKLPGDTISGYGITLSSTSENATVKDCKFYHFNSGIYGAGNVADIDSCYFTGSSTQVTNDGKKEKGTKAINLMGAKSYTVRNCTFEGQLLDAVSVASGSSNVKILNNTMVDNCYAIYFGGASTDGSIISDNRFVNCGYYKDREGVTKFENLPVISTQKSATGYTIKNNEFTTNHNNTVFIKGESKNTAHGYPSDIGNILISENRVIAEDGVNPATVTFYYILSNAGELNPKGDIKVIDNNIDAGITPVTVWLADYNVANSTDIIIKSADPVSTSIEIVDLSTATKKLTLKLIDVNGKELSGATISYSINAAPAKTVETDADGLATIDVTEDGVVAVAFAGGKIGTGNDVYKATETTVKFTSTVTKTTPTITASALTTTANVGKFFTATLKDATGKALVGETVTFFFNGQSTTAKTDENGIAKLNINVAKKGKYQITVSYLGNDNNNAVVAVQDVTVNAQATKAVFKAKTFKVKAKTKKVQFTLKDASGKAIKGKKITITVNKKTYTAKTNAKGVATVKVKLTKKGKYTATAKFAGDDTYKAISKKAKITVKK